MILIEIADWAWQNKREITLNALLLLILRKFIIHEMHKLFHFGREGEVKWLIDKVQVLTGEKYNLQPAFLRTAGTRYINSYYFYLRKVIKHLNPRRKKKMQNNINWLTLIPAVIGALKLILQPFGLDISHITDAQVNDVANGIAAVATIIGIFLPHTKGVTSNVPTQPTGDSGAAV